jgi:chemotaxis protein CheX
MAQKMDVNFFQPFVAGTINVLKIQCSVVAKPLKPFFKGDQATPSVEIAGIIGLVSNTYAGVITLCFPGPVFLHIMSNMLGETYTTITKDLEDGAAELMNIIFGQAKLVLKERGYVIEKAIPSVATGQNISTTLLTTAKVIVIPFETEKGLFHIEVSLEEKKIAE